MESKAIKLRMEESKSLLAFYDRKEGTFRYHEDLLSYLGDSLKDKMLWDHFAQAGLLPYEEIREIREICMSLDPENSFFAKYYQPVGMSLHSFIFSLCGDTVTIALKDLTPDIAYTKRGMFDDLTGLLSRNAYYSRVKEIMDGNKDRKYAMFFFDIVKFKAVNDLCGFSEGDKLLLHIADVLRSEKDYVLTACRLVADRFAFLADVTDKKTDDVIYRILGRVEDYVLPVSVSCNVGIYMIKDREETAQIMLDKAVLAQSVIKGNYTHKINYFTTELRNQMISEQEILGSVNAALEEKQFVVYYQPQYNHSTGAIVGAEALVRWRHPVKGLISPGVFIPIFEKTGFVTKLDFYVFEAVCLFLRKCMNEGRDIVPVSVNFSAKDVYLSGFVRSLEEIRSRYDVPVKYLRVELTERVSIVGCKSAEDVFEELHNYGYVIEMDDFGSGYSSLNILKNLKFDIVKLDMLFLDDHNYNDRGGIILTSVVHMAKWLKMPVIAEGVETVEQADFLKSIGCNYMQGYLYAQPLPEQEYRKLLSANRIGIVQPPMDLIANMDFARFWDLKSTESLIFNNFAEGATVFHYDLSDLSVEVLRVNKRCMMELGMNLSEWDVIHRNFAEFLRESDRAAFYQMLDRTVETQQEHECETWLRIHSDSCGESTICLRNSVRLISGSGDRFLICGMIRNITGERSAPGT